MSSSKIEPWPITPATPLQGHVLLDVVHEWARQDQKWGVQNHEPLYWLDRKGCRPAIERMAER